jgi:predicted phosphodiesterase
MIYFLSDLHGEFFDALKEYEATYKHGDLLIILGDLELSFKDTSENKAFTEYFLNLKCPIAIIDGNHENFDHLYSFPEEEWRGGKVHRLSENIVHLQRGNIYNIGEKSFFVMGGCKSSQKWKDQGLWWPQENPTPDEISFAYENLKNHGYSVDYILTHKHEILEDADEMSLEGLLSYIENNVSYKHWFSGHWHKSFSPDDKHTVIYDKLTQLK